MTTMTTTTTKIPYREWRDVPDKAQWGAGPWQSEPDRVQWQDEVTQLACLAVRNSYLGSWCGYVGVDDTHPAYGFDYSHERIEQLDLDVHGGLTYSGECEGRICHEVEDGADVWWFGFDCAHGWDRSPGAEASLKQVFSRARMEREISLCAPGGTYKTLDYVRAQCRKLAVQIAAARGKL